MRKVIALVFFFSSFAFAAAAESVRVVPFDQADQQLDFKVFRDALLEAVKARDIEAVAAAAAETIEISFGGDAGRATFRDYLAGKIEGIGPEYWAELERVLTLGGAFGEDGLFVAPYYYADTAPLPEEVDFFTVFYCTGDKVRVRAGPSTNDAVIGQLSYDVVVADDPDKVAASDASGRDWFYVRTFEGLKGWVAADFLGSPAGYRAGFQKLDGKWQMIFFVAGD